MDHERTLDPTGRSRIASEAVHALRDYENSTTGRAERRPVTFHAILVAEPGGWRLSIIR